MKKSKITFAVLAGIVLIFCILIMVFGDHEEIAPAYTDSEIPATDIATEPIPVESIYNEFPDNPYEFTLAGNVRINQVEKDPNEVVHYGEPVLEGDPEYIEYEHGMNYGSPEGKVYRNDKTISIDIFDEMGGETLTFTFGYITGECNHYLYLNPVCEQAERNTRYAFHFIPVRNGGGSVVTIPQKFNSEKEYNSAIMKCYNFTTERALDQRSIAAYQDPTHPGTIWFTQQPLDGNLWLNCLVYGLGGDFVASLRLTIAKAADGTYSIVNLENNNLLQKFEEEGTEYDKDELAVIYTEASKVIADPSLVSIATANDSAIDIESMIIEYRDKYTGLYYPYIIPAGGGLYTQSNAYLDSPVIAVSVRRYQMGACAVTMYFRIVKEPTENTQGVYEYIGRDFLLYSNMDALINQGHPSY